MISDTIRSAPMAGVAPAPPQPSTPATPAPAPSVPVDGFSPARQAFESSASVVGATIGAAGSVIPNGLMGGIHGASRVSDGNDLGEGATALQVLQTSVAGGLAGGVVGGPVGAIVGAGVGLVGGLMHAGMHIESKAAKEVGTAIRESVNLAVSDNEPTGSRVRDLSKDFSEGAVVGAIHGTRASYEVGRREAAGMAGGLVDGSRGAAAVLRGDYDAPVPSAPAGAPDSMGDRVLGLPRLVLGGAVGAAAGVANASLNAVYGAVDGTVKGIDVARGHAYSGSPEVREGLVTTQTTALGATVGTMVAGPVGFFVGGAAGAFVGGLVNRTSYRTGASQEQVAYTMGCVEKAAAGNAPSGDIVYGTFRNGVQGAVVGSTAAMKAGMKVGFEAGRGATDGLLDGIKGVVEGVIGAVRPPGPKPSPSPSPEQPQPAPGTQA